VAMNGKKHAYSVEASNASPRTGMLVPLACTSCGNAELRSIALDGSSSWVIVATGHSPSARSSPARRNATKQNSSVFWSAVSAPRAG
jgi:hypothetical protein